MRALIPLLLVMAAALPAFGQARESYELRPVVLVDGSTVHVRVKVPCEVQGNRPAVGVEESPAPCTKCGEKCACVGGCPCHAAAKAEAAARAERPRSPAPESDGERCARIGRLRLNWVHNGQPVTGTVAQYLHLGGTIDAVIHPELTEGDRAFARANCKPKPWVQAVVHPVAQPMPVYASPVYHPGVSVQFHGPFGGSVGGQVCLPGR